MKIVKAFPTDLKVSEGERSVVARISTSAVDRDGEVLEPKGLFSKNYEKNPIVLFNHNSMALPIGKCVSLVRGEKDITAKTVFAERPKDYPPDAEWLPDTVLSLFQQGMLNSFSVGFNPIDMPRSASPKDVEKFGEGVRRVFGKWELLEYSVVTIPANQEAVAVAVSKGFDGAMNYMERKPVVAKAPEYVVHLPIREQSHGINLAELVNNSIREGTRKARGYVYVL